MRTKAAIAVMVALLVFYALLIGVKGVALLGSGAWEAVLLGVGLLVLPLLGLLLVAREIRFGSRTARLAAVLESEGGLPADDLPRRPSGRVDRAAADERFERHRAETEAAPDDWRSWYRLALAYDDAGDRRRAREAARRAVTLFDAAGRG